MLSIYSIVIFFYGALIRVVALFSSKAKLWISGRKNWRKNLLQHTPEGGFDLWMHCSSLGEFEQGRPVLEAYRSCFPHASMLLSFYSPSGYEIRKNYEQVDHVAYLPLDTKKNAEDWMKIVQPQKTIFVKYDFWFNFLKVIKQHSTHAIIISALFHEKHFFNSWLGRKFQYLLNAFKIIFLQKELGFKLQNPIETRVSGDTRVDRVLQIRKEFKKNKALENWAFGSNVMVWGSVWNHDFFLLEFALNKSLKHWKHIIAPHEPSAAILESIQRISSLPNQLLSEEIEISNRVIIVDSIGQLSALYNYGSAAYIGGGFGKGIHNTLEPLAAECPVIIGPKFSKFPEAKEGQIAACVFSINDEQSFHKISGNFDQPDFLTECQKSSRNFINTKAGATAEIINYLLKIR